jgi:hypothetical protein
MTEYLHGPAENRFRVDDWSHDLGRPLAYYRFATEAAAEEWIVERESFLRELGGEVLDPTRREIIRRW